MAEGNACGGQCRSRSALGDVTNSKRGFSGREKDGRKSFDFNERDAVKRVCVSPLPCSEINTLKGNIISSLSKTSNENRDSNLYGDCDGVHCLKEKQNVTRNSKFHAGCDKGRILDPRGGNVVSQSVNELDVVDKKIGNRRDQTEVSKHSQPKVDEVASQYRVDPNMANLEEEMVLDSIANGADVCSQLDMIKDNKIPEVAEVANENNCSSLDIGMFDTIHFVNTEANNELGDSFPADTSRTVSKTSNAFLHDGQNCDAGDEIISREGTQNDINNDLDDHNADNFVMSQSGSIDCAFLPQSQESRVFGIEKSAEPKEDECAHLTAGTNAIKACSCSFCTKAAYIWLDLHQKDIKARLSAFKKNQKDARILAERSCRIKVNDTHSVESINTAFNLESHLMHQWRSLFQHMSDTWEAESNQLEASLLPLNNLRDRCKGEMELINAERPEKQ